MRVFTYSPEALQRFSNQVKEVVVQSLTKGELLTEEQATKYLEEHIVLVTEKGFCGRLIDKYFNLDTEEKGTQVIHVVKRT